MIVESETCHKCIELQLADASSSEATTKLAAMQSQAQKQLYHQNRDLGKRKSKTGWSKTVLLTSLI